MLVSKCYMQYSLKVSTKTSVGRKNCHARGAVCVHGHSSTLRDTLLSEYNYQMRSHLKSSRSFGLNIEAGDICYIDYGRAYISEIGYQHFGLVLKVFCGKAFVLPMTSNENNYSLAYDPVSNPDGLRHLMRLGKVEGLYRYSVLFLNDGKFINTARIIDIKGHIDPQGELFERIRSRFISCLE